MRLKRVRTDVPNQKRTLNAQMSAQTSASMTPEPSTLTNGNGVTEQERYAIIIDYSSLEIEAKNECKCGYVLADAQIMVGWCSKFTASNNLRCIMCRQFLFVLLDFLFCVYFYL